MESSPRVSPGDPLVPESAARYNALSDALNCIGHLGPRSPEGLYSGSSDVITCINSHEEMIPAGSFVSVGRPHLWTPDQEMSSYLYEMTPGTMPPCGLLLTDVMPGKTGEVQLSGLAEGASFAAPQEALKIFQHQDDVKALYLLNANNCYNNYFKVVVTQCVSGKITEVKIIDGAKPDSGIAGLTDLCEVYSQTLAVENGCFVCLSAERNYEHVFEMRSELPDEKSPCIVLAEIYENNLIQRWTGGRIYWRNRFVIPLNRGDF